MFPCSTGCGSKFQSFGACRLDVIYNNRRSGVLFHVINTSMQMNIGIDGFFGLNVSLHFPNDKRPIVSSTVQAPDSLRLNGCLDMFSFSNVLLLELNKLKDLLWEFRVIFSTSEYKTISLTRS